MPGTKIVLNAGEPDPDPAPYLFVSDEIKKRIAEKPYDPKRSCYVPHPEEKFCEGMIEETTGTKVQVKIHKLDPSSNQPEPHVMNTRTT